jgi:hypothetical protein
MATRAADLALHLLQATDSGGKDVQIGVRAVAVMVIALLGAAGCTRSCPRLRPVYPAERFPELGRIAREVVAAPERACDDVALLGHDPTVGLPAAPIAVEGVPTMTYLVCTQLLCENGCCNFCRGDGYYVRHALPRGQHVWIHLIVGECEGNECDINCRPFGHRPRSRYRFVGTLVRFAAATSRARYGLKVERFCRQGGGRIRATIGR